MHVILGATDSVARSVAEQLLIKNESVLVVAHDPDTVRPWHEKGARVALADILQPKALHKIFVRGRRLFLLNPPGNREGNPVLEEKRSLASILEGLKNTPMEKIIGESAYGAQAGHGKGDFSVMHDMEMALKQQGIPSIILRSAFSMSHWDAFVAMALEKGKIDSFYPETFKIPMVAPDDTGKFAAKLMQEDPRFTGLRYLEGPARYAAEDVAKAFSRVLGKTVRVEHVPSERWLSYLLNMGYSKDAANAMAEMASITLDGRYEKPHRPERGATSIDEYVDSIVRQQLH